MTMKEKPEHVRCENCIFWEREKHLEDLGMCRHLPPVPSETSDRLLDGIAKIYSVLSGISVDDDAIQVFSEPGYMMDHANFPSSHEDQWCGEFKADWPA